MADRGPGDGGGVAAALLFDIDGTLISTGGHRTAPGTAPFWSSTTCEVNVPDYTGKGVPDPEVGLECFRGALGREPEGDEMAKLMALRQRYLAEEVESSPGYEVMPGVVELLDRLTAAGRLVGLITGNTEPAAHTKLARADLNRYFAFGGYGSDANARVDVCRKALDRAGQLAGSGFDRDGSIAIGDTPLDVEAGHGAGIRVSRRRDRRVLGRAARARPGGTGWCAISAPATSLSDSLRDWLALPGGHTVGGLIELFEEKSFAILFVLLLGVPALPLPTGGVTHVFEVIAVLGAAQLVIGRDRIWLPQKWRRLELAGPRQQRFLAGLMKLIGRLERLSKPRFTFLFGSRLSNAVFGLIVVAGSVPRSSPRRSPGSTRCPRSASSSSRSRSCSRT